jgi:hypothetical protein
MTHEARINEALKQLGEEYRLGMVQAEEYRTRRRMLIDSWDEEEVTTSPGSLRSVGLSTIPPGKRKAFPLVSSRTPKLVLTGLAVAVAMVVSAWLTFGSRKAETDAPVANLPPPPAPLSAPVQAARKAAEDLLMANAWEAASIEAVLVQWRQLSPEDRVQAREQPAVRTLRFKLDQNIQAESQLVAPDAPPEDRQRLDLLTRFAEELDM